MAPRIGRSLASVAFLLSLMFVAGCLGPSAAVPTETPSGGPQPDPESGKAAPAVPATARYIPVTGSVATDGLFPPDQVACDPLRAGVCESYSSMLLNVTGTLTGRILANVRLHGLPNGSVMAQATRIFTGIVDGCGAGTMSMGLNAIIPHVEPNSERRGFIHVKEPIQTLTDGSTTNGLRGLIGAKITFEFNMTGAGAIQGGTLTGGVVCQGSQDPAALTRRAGAGELRIQDRFTSDGFQTRNVASCDPARAGGCEVTATLYLDFVGTMTGRVVDQGHLHPTGANGSFYGEFYRFFTGTIAGCGSGSAAFVFRDAGRFEPGAEPGSVHLREPIMRLVPGSTTTGLANLVDASLRIEFNTTQQQHIRDGTITGSVWCRAGMPPTRGPAETVPFGGRFTTDGSLLAETLACSSNANGACDSYSTRLLFGAGGNAIIIDSWRLRITSTGSQHLTAERVFIGSVQGCGSGMMTLRSSGPQGTPSPDATRPGHMKTVEPSARLVSGSTTTGLADAIDAELRFESVLKPTGAGDVLVSGSLLCAKAEAGH